MIWLWNMSFLWKVEETKNKDWESYCKICFFFWQTFSSFVQTWKVKKLVAAKPLHVLNLTRCFVSSTTHGWKPIIKSGSELMHGPEWKRLIESLHHRPLKSENPMKSLNIAEISSETEHQWWLRVVCHVLSLDC